MFVEIEAEAAEVEEGSVVVLTEEELLALSTTMNATHTLYEPEA